MSICSVNSNSTIVTAKPPTPTNSMLNRNSNETAEMDSLKRQLKSSEMTISELKTMVEKLTMENSHLKTRIDSQVIADDVQL
jgi:predicted nuclease with TOPRIM domain